MNAMEAISAGINKKIEAATAITVAAMNNRNMNMADEDFPAATFKMVYKAVDEAVDEAIKGKPELEGFWNPPS